MLIGLAIAIKVTPLIFAVYFFWKGRWIVAVAALASVAIWSLVVPAVAFGWDQNLRWLEQWMQIMIVPYVTRREVLYPISQSFGSFALRLLSPIPVFETVKDGVPYGHYMNIVQLSESTVSQLVRGVMFGSGSPACLGPPSPADVPMPAVSARDRRRDGVHALVLRAHLGASLRQLRAHAVRGRCDAERQRNPHEHAARSARP